MALRPKEQVHIRECCTPKLEMQAWPAGGDHASGQPWGRIDLKHNQLNPVVLGGKVAVTLPFDSDRVLACDFGSGKLVWTAKRSRAHRLTGLRLDPVLLSGDAGWRLLPVSDGKVLTSNSSTPIYSEPGVIREAAWMSARVLRLKIDSSEVGIVGRIFEDCWAISWLSAAVSSPRTQPVCAYKLDRTSE